MPRYDQSRMCSECPFRAKAPPGWLGPWAPEEIEAVARRDEAFICHIDIARIEAEGEPGEVAGEHGQHCVGMLRYMNAMHKLSRDPTKARRQLELKQIQDQDVIPAGQFRAYHADCPRRTR